MIKIIFVLFMALVSCFSSFAETLSEKQLLTLNKQIKKYDYVGPFFEGLAMVRKGEKVGFIDKTGKLAIPMKYNATDKCVSPFGDFLNIFHNGMLVSYELGVIDRHGKVLVPKDSIKDIGFANDGDIVIVTSKSQYFVYEKGTFVSNRQPFWNFTSNEVLTINDKVVYDEDLEARGYTRFDSEYTEGKTYCSVRYAQPFVVQKNGKFGIIDRLGNEMVPCFSENYNMVYYKGLVLVPQYARLLLDTGKEKFPIWYDVYKNGVKVLEKVSTDKPFKGHNFIFVFGISEELYNVWKEEYKIELPQSVKDSVMFDLSGKRIKRAPFGKNYFTCDNTGKIILVKEDGTPVFNENSVFYEPIDSYYLVEFDSDYRPCLLNEDGDTVKASSCLLRYVNDGTLSFLDLRRYSNIDRDNISYFSSQSKQDKLATLEFYSGRLPVKPQQFDTMFFSEGLINLKINGVWCYMNEKGLGLPKKH